MKKKFFKNFDIGMIIGFTVIGLYALSLLISLFWMFLSSVKDGYEFLGGNFLFDLPKKGWKFDNYTKALEFMYITVEKVGAYPEDVFLPQLFLNSLLYALGSTFVSTVSHFVMAYATAKYEFKLKNVIYGIVVVAMILPIVGALPSEIQMARALGVYDNFFGVVCVMKCTFLGMHFLIFYAMFKSIPDSYAEAARIDGAGHWCIMLKIVLPLSMNVTTGIALLSFISYWNDYQTPMIYLPSMPTVAFGLFRFQNSPKTGVTIPMILSACVMAASPMLIIFIIFRNKIMGNLAVGGIKG